MPELAALERVFADGPWPWRRVAAGVRERTSTVLAARPEDTRVALLTYAVEMVCAMAVELATRPVEAAQLITEVERASGISPLALGREVLRAPELVRLPPAAAAEVVLRLLAIFAPLREVSLWTRDEQGRLRCVRRIGGGARTPGGERALAELVLGGHGTAAQDAPDAGARRPPLALAISRWERPVGVLIAHPERGTRERCAAFTAETVAILGIVLERDDLLSRSAAAERSLLGPAERRLSRLGIDLHDGPLQDLAVLGEELRLLRDQLPGMLAHTQRERLVRGRLDDLEGQLVALDAELRRLSSSLQPPAVRRQSLALAVRELTEEFSQRSGILTDLRLRGDEGAIGEPVTLAVIAVVRESLANVRRHSDATEVSVTVTTRPDRIEAEVRDNGRGFDVERTLMRSARAGHLGLAGLHERVRMLGGHTTINSSPGGPTQIAVVLPRLAPDSAAPRDGRER